MVDAQDLFESVRLIDYEHNCLWQRVVDVEPFREGIRFPHPHPHQTHRPNYWLGSCDVSAHDFPTHRVYWICAGGRTRFHIRWASGSIKITHDDGYHVRANEIDLVTARLLEII